MPQQLGMAVASKGVPALVNNGGQANEKDLAMKRLFGFTITNNTGIPQVVYLNNMYNMDAGAKVIADGEIGGVGGLTAASTGNHTIAEFLEWFKWHPTRITALQIQTSDVNQFASALTIQKKTLFNNEQPLTLPLSAFQNPNNQQDKLIIVKSPDWQLDYDTENFLPIYGSGGGAPVACTVTFTFYFGHYVDTVSSLAQYSKRAS